MNESVEKMIELLGEDGVIELVEMLKRRKRESRAAARQQRQFLISASGGHCFTCFTHLPSILEIHHADPVVEMGGTDPLKLYPICPNCHAFVHLLRKARLNSDRRDQLKEEIFHAHEGDDRVVMNLLYVADQVSTMDKIKRRLATQGLMGDQE